MTRQEIDLQLLQKIKEGNQNAFINIFNHYYNSLNYNIWIIVRNHEDAEDVTMMTFEKAYININKYTPTSSFASWLNKIARNTALDFISYKHKNKYTFFDINEFSYLKSHENNPEELLMDKELIEQIEIALKELPSHLKEAITLWYDRELLCREMAEKQNVSINTLIGRIRYARKHLNLSLVAKEVI